MISDQGLKALAFNGNKFMNLSLLYLNNNQIRDEGLKAFSLNGDKFK
jgi:hypothetical protein